MWTVFRDGFALWSTAGAGLRPGSRLCRASSLQALVTLSQALATALSLEHLPGASFTLCSGLCQEILSALPSWSLRSEHK